MKARSARRAEESLATLLFTLGRAGMPYYYRGKVKDPLRAAARHDRRSYQAPRTQGKKEEPPRSRNMSDFARRIGGSIIRSDKNFERSGVVVLRMEDRDDEALAKGLRELTSDPLVEAAGAVVRLSEHHASFLTDLIIARFDETVNDSASPLLPGRFGLTPEGRFKALGNVHRLRFAGPATYAVIEAANALAEEPEVVWSEPNLAATSEEDAVSPDRFSFSPSNGIID